MGALTNLGTIVVQDKGPGEDRVKNLVTEGVLHDLVLDAIRLDEPFLRLIDEKLIVSSGAVGSVPELFLEICNSLQRIGLHLCDGTFPSLSLSGGPIRCIQIREVINGFKRLIWFQKGTSVADSQVAPLCEPPGVNAMCLPPALSGWGGMHLPLMVGFCFHPSGLLNRSFHRSRAHAPVAVVRVVVVEAPVRVHVAHVVRVRRVRGPTKAHRGGCTYKAHPWARIIAGRAAAPWAVHSGRPGPAACTSRRPSSSTTLPGS